VKIENRKLCTINQVFNFKFLKPLFLLKTIGYISTEILEVKLHENLAGHKE